MQIAELEESTSLIDYILKKSYQMNSNYFYQFKKNRCEHLFYNFIHIIKNQNLY